MKFGYFEKATKFPKNFPIFLTLLFNGKKNVRFFSNLVAFLEYPNFKGAATFNTLDTVNLTNGISNEKHLDFDGFLSCANYVFEIIAVTRGKEKDVLVLDFQIGPDLLHENDIMISNITDSKGK
jgi:hypothetical protein